MNPLYPSAAWSSRYSRLCKSATQTVLRMEPKQYSCKIPAVSAIRHPLSVGFSQLFNHIRFTSQWLETAGSFSTVYLTAAIFSVVMERFLPHRGCSETEPDAMNLWVSLEIVIRQRVFFSGPKKSGDLRLVCT